MLLLFDCNMCNVFIDSKKKYTWSQKREAPPSSAASTSNEPTSNDSSDSCPRKV